MAAALPGIEALGIIHEGPIWKEYRARQVPLGRAVRVLELGRGILPSSPLAGTLRRQAHALAALEHPAIVRLFEFREDEGLLALVVEDALDPSLADLLDQPLALDASRAIGLSLGRALAHAHGRGIVHGQLGPQAVRLDREGRIKLEGFGGAASESEAEPIEPVGRAGLAPETTIGQQPSAASDLFALGAILYQALSGQAPFGDPTDPKYPSRVRNDAPTPLVRLRPEAPLAIRQMVERCLSKVPAERPADAAQLVASLSALPGGTTDGAIQSELLRRRWVPETSDPPVAVEPIKARQRSFGPLLALVSTGIVGAALASAVWLVKERAGRPPSPDLSLATMQNPDAMLLRVVATPWAHVLVDGVHRETTPFANPIRLAPGRHVVRLEHPSAPPEERAIEGVRGQALMLDVRMSVQRPPSSPISEAPSVESSP
jgi:serine/threonine protein kinase